MPVSNPNSGADGGGVGATTPTPTEGRGACDGADPSAGGVCAGTGLTPARMAATVTTAETTRNARIPDAAPMALPSLGRTHKMQAKCRSVHRGSQPEVTGWWRVLTWASLFGCGEELDHRGEVLPPEPV